MSKIIQWAKAIKEEEGWFAPRKEYPRGSVSWRNNNPGNLRYSKFQVRIKNGYSVFDTYIDGWKALIFQLTIALNGKSKVYKPHMSLLEFFQKYAPGEDNNRPRKYAQNVASKLGVNINTPIKELG